MKYVENAYAVTICEILHS